jgi:hypothetical protein
MGTPEDSTNNGDKRENGSSVADAMNSFFKQFTYSIQTNNDRIILEELSKEYDRNSDLRKQTEGKANTIITFSGVILTLLLAFIALSFDHL